jgi:hypothetical protein
MATSLAPVSKTNLMKKVASQAKSLQRYRAKAAAVGERVMETGLTVGGGALAGYMAVKFPGQWVGVDKEIWVGGGFLVAGLTGIGGSRMSDAALAIGNGMMAVWAANMVRSKVAAG